jgi:hypothetical protein
MSASWKKSWTVRSYLDAVLKMVKLMPRVYEDGTRLGIIGWVGRTYSHQRKDVKSKPPKLSVDKGNRLIFQHDLITPFTYTVEVSEEEDEVRVTVEVKTAGTHRDTTAGEQAVTLFYVLTKALEPS